MKNILAILTLIMLLTLSGCKAIGDIFSAGVYTGVFIVVFIIVVIIFIIVKLGKRE
jgi:hypothetical protein